jgi:DNA uptake protein ComE-like DNA-binding protein
MKFFKSHFWYNNSQRNGILFLILIIVSLQLFYFLIDFTDSEITNLDTTEINQFQQEVDSLKLISGKNKIKIYPFNPSFLTDFKGYQLGLSTDEIDRLLKYRAKGKYINSAKEFQQITKINDSLLKSIEPYFKFPEWVNNLKIKKISQGVIKSDISIITSLRDLNSVNKADLELISGINKKLAARIINYRNKLGGFYYNDQLYEVFYLEKSIANKILEKYRVIKKPLIHKININTATFKEVLSIVYIDYDLTKKIFNFKDEVAELQSIEELKKIEGFPIEKFNRIALYLEAK